MTGWLIWIALVLVVGAGIALALLPVVVNVLRAQRRRALVRNAPQVRADARVVDKRTQIYGASRNAPVQRYYATFELSDGNRLELEVSGREFGMLVVGDAGVLDWKGPLYRGFARAIMR